MSDVVIRVENLGKKYRIRHEQREPYTALRDVLTNKVACFGSSVLGKGRRLLGVNGKVNADEFPISDFRSPISGRTQPSSEDFWALKKVCCEVKHGEVVGIIGRNGAGKSTLLKLLSRITEPTEGCIRIKGRLASLLEVGTGFHPELTGRENIFLNGAILGMKQEEIRRKFDEIIAFAEVETFLDTPVKHYSSGMYVRLAFAVAAHLESEILVVDEVLAVGDAAFQKKCLGKMGDVAKDGRTVLFVSHNMAVLNRLCQKSLWLDNGELKLEGLTYEVISQYLTNSANLGGRCVWQDGTANVGVDELKVFGLRVYDDIGEITSNIDGCKAFSVEIEYRICKPLPFCRVGFELSTTDGVTVFEAYDSDDERYLGKRIPGSYIAKCKVFANLLNTGRYILSINAGIPNVKNLAFLQAVLAIDIQDFGAVGSSMHTRRVGIVRPQFKWETESILPVSALE